MPNDLEILMPVHDINTKSRYQYFVQTCYYLHLHHKPTFAIMDHVEPPMVYNVLKYFKIAPITVQTDPTKQAQEWIKLKEIYDLSTAKYIAICHADDYWMEGKLEKQLKYIEHSAMVMSSYLIMEPHKFPGQWGRLALQTPQNNPNLGCLNCMPSMWVLNKKYVPTLDIPYDAVTAIDLGIALTIAQQGPITVLREPTMIWNHHLENNTHKLRNTPLWEEALVKQRKLAKELCAPIFRYIPMEE